MDKISVIVPCYNVEKWIDRCVASIVKQTIGMSNMEIILVDDCSTDTTVDHLVEWESRYPDNIMIIKCERNARQGAARNIGLEYSTGEWIAFIDSDDWIEHDYLEKLFSVAKKGKYEIVCCGNIRDSSVEACFDKKNTLIDADNIAGQESVIDSVSERRKVIMHPVIGYSAWAKLIKKKLLVDNELFFSENVTYEDAAWGSLLNLYYKKAFIIEEKLYHYFINNTSTVLTSNSNHHIDCLTVQTYAWREYFERGFMEEYRDELVIEHIFSAFLPGIKMLILRYDKPDYNIYLLLRELMLDRIADYRTNPYIINGILSDKYMLIMSTLDNKLNKQEFYEFAESLKKIGI